MRTATARRIERAASGCRRPKEEKKARSQEAVPQQQSHKDDKQFGHLWAAFNGHLTTGI